jgi:hypothetical protein
MGVRGSVLLLLLLSGLGVAQALYFNVAKEVKCPWSYKETGDGADEVVASVDRAIAASCLMCRSRRRSGPSSSLQTRRTSW